MASRIRDQVVCYQVLQVIEPPGPVVAACMQQDVVRTILSVHIL